MENLDTLMNEALARETARVAVTDFVLDVQAPSVAWQHRDKGRTALEGMLYNEALILQVTLELIREDVEEARAEGVSWARIGKALDMPAEMAASAFGGEVIEP